MSSPTRILAHAFSAAGVRPPSSAKRGVKKNYAEALSRELATAFANSLRRNFPGILPDAEGKSQESRARTVKGFKKLDVNYSTLELGLGLGVSIKTVNFRDPSTKRYTKNYTRVDNELRAEAVDYHTRQPFSVLVGALFIPVDSCDDGSLERKSSSSSFGQAVKVLRFRAGRASYEDPAELFERFYIALYDYEQLMKNQSSKGGCVFFDVTEPPPRARRLREGEGLSFRDVLSEIKEIYDERNASDFEWAPD